MQPHTNLVLTGFMGTGKTTVGRELSRRLGMKFVDTDELIESRHGPIATIFEEHGEEAFREIEREVAVELGTQRGLVISTGGRMVLDPASLTELTRHGRVFCLVATPEEVHRRVSEDATRRDRPLLRAEDLKERIIDLQAEREEGYAQFPQVVTDNRDPEAIADEIAELWRDPADDNPVV